MPGKREYFVLFADGNSMTDSGIDDSDYVIIVRKRNTADYGKIVVALDKGNRNTLKRLELYNENKNLICILKIRSTRTSILRSFPFKV